MTGCAKTFGRKNDRRSSYSDDLRTWKRLEENREAGWVAFIAKGTAIFETRLGFHDQKSVGVGLDHLMEADRFAPITVS